MNSWNPLRVDSFQPRPNLLLMAKLIVIYLISIGEFYQFSDGFLPFWNLGGAWGPAPGFKLFLQVLFWIFSFFILFNRWPRFSCAALGLTMLISVLTSRVLFSNTRVFFACLLFLTGLQEKDRDVFLLRWQVVLIYFGAGLNKLFDPDWLNGQFMSHWLTGVLNIDFYRVLSEKLGSGIHFKILGWGTIATELFLAAAFLFPKTYRAGIIMGLLFHSVMIPLSGGSVSYLFLYAMACSYLAFIEWPAVSQKLRFKPAFYFSLAAIFILFQHNIQRFLG